MEYFIVLTPEEPILTGEVKPKGDYLGTRSYIPGSVLRGALAEWFKAQGNEQDILRTVQRIRFGNFFPTPSEGVYALPFPMTALECKLNGGFQKVPREKHKDAGHGIRDSLLIVLAYSELERLGVRFPVPMLLRCTAQIAEDKRCGGRMERVSGFYANLPEGWVKVSVSKGMQTKAALSRYRRAAQEQMLYRVMALCPRGCFVGRIWTDDASVISALQEAVTQKGLGALTTRGFGTARLKEAERASLPQLTERLRQFNEKLREVWHDLANLAQQVGSSVPGEPRGIYFSVDLLAPALLHDRHGLPTLRLELSLNGQPVAPVWWATQPVFIGGWSTAWGLPKPTGMGAAQGSVYVFYVESTMEEILPWLETLEARGVGDRTDEGLGEVLICHPFHKEVMPV